MPSSAVETGCFAVEIVESPNPSSAYEDLARLMGMYFELEGVHQLVREDVRAPAVDPVDPDLMRVAPIRGSEAGAVAHWQGQSILAWL